MPEKRSNDPIREDSASKRIRSQNGFPAPAPPSATDVIAQARALAAAARAKLQQAGTITPAAAGGGLADLDEDARRAKIEEIKARAAAAKRQSAAASAVASSTAVFQQQQQQQQQQQSQKHEYEDTYHRARGGLGIGLHPALMGDAGQDARAKGKAVMGPKFATTMANRRPESPAADAKGKKKIMYTEEPDMEEIKANPYFDANLLGATSASARPRQSRTLVFNQKGKYMAQGAALRRQANLEALKKRMAEARRKANLDETNEKSFLTAEPPVVEWWDEGLLVEPSYDDIDLPGKTKIDTEDSIITLYIQHPVRIEPPQDKNAPAPKPMYLTKDEQAKLRRIRRMAENQEQQAKIRLGLEPPPPPKVKKSNLMRVLGEQAVKDPTAVEARVNREIAERAATHHEANEQRKLTKTQQHEKLASQQAADAARGIHVSVYKIDNLSFGKHRYKIDINAKQNELSGICIVHPRMNLVIVEGGQHSIANYRKLLLNRVNWTENDMPSAVREGNREAEQKWPKNVDEDGKLLDLSENRCVLVWEGQERSRVFKRWFGMKICETDGEARDALKKSGMENMWTLAKDAQ